MGASFAENVYRRKPKGSYYTTSVGLSMMCYRIRKRRKDVFRRSPVERTHGEACCGANGITVLCLGLCQPVTDEYFRQAFEPLLQNT